jgi:Flp pilus assembly protein TadG
VRLRVGSDPKLAKLEREGSDVHMRRLTDYIRRRNNGTALVEMALVLPLLLLLVFGMIDFGLVIKDKMALIQAAREGARVAAIGETTASIKSTVVASSPALAISAANITLKTGAASTNPSTWSSLGDTTDSQGVAVNNAPAGNLIQVSIVSTHSTVTRMFFGGASSLTISGNSVMRKEAR